MKRTLVIILNYNSWQDTLKEIEIVNAIIAKSKDAILVIDNDSPNDSFSELQKANHGEYELIKADENRGYAAGNNIGLRYAHDQGYSYAWILNNDILIDDRTVLDEMIHIMEKNHDIAVINPDIYSPSGYLYNRDAKKYSFWDMTLGMFSYRKKGRLIADLGGYGYVYRPQGCCMLIDVKKAAQVNYLDECTFLYCEEIIFAERLIKYGYRAACLLTYKVVHNHSATVKNAIKRKKILQIKEQSFAYYLKAYRHYNPFQIWLCTKFDYIKQMRQ